MASPTATIEVALGSPPTVSEGERILVGHDDGKVMAAKGKRRRHVAVAIVLAVVVLAAVVAAVVVTTSDNGQDNGKIEVQAGTDMLNTDKEQASVITSSNTGGQDNDKNEVPADAAGTSLQGTKEDEKDKAEAADPRDAQDVTTVDPPTTAAEEMTAVSSAASSSAQSCSDDPDWFTITNRGKVRDCAYIAAKDAGDRSTLCGRLGRGQDDDRRGAEACPNACLGGTAAVAANDSSSSANATRSCTLTFSVEQITPPDSPHHFMFGYIGQSLTIPWDATDRYVLALRFDSHDRLPTIDDVAVVVRIDTSARDESGNYVITPLDTSRAWNTQQGTMFYWNPEAPETQFFFNDRDEESGKIFTVLFDTDRMERIREYRYDDTPIANAGVCPQGGFFYALNYGRMARLRPVTGYQGAFDWTFNETYPSDDGLWKVDIGTGEKELLVSLADIDIENVMASENGIDGNKILAGSHLYINHALSNRQCSKIYFFGRGAYQGGPNPLVSKPEMAIDKPFVVNADGTGLKRVKHIGGHPEWSMDGNTVFGRTKNMPSMKNQIVMYNVETDSITGALGSYFSKTSGDLMLSESGEMFANGWEEGEDLVYAVVRLDDGANGLAPLIHRGNVHTSGDLRIDAAPRWNRRGDKLLVPGWSSSNNKRSLNVISVGS